MRTALVIPIFNRPEYVRRCFESLKKLVNKPDIYIIVDDGSTDKEIDKLMTGHFWNKNALCKTHRTNLGVRAALITGCDEAIKQGADIIINLDSDAVVTPDFIERLVWLKGWFAADIISGFNCVTERNPNVKDNGSHYVKHYCNGINMCFDKRQYEQIIMPALLKEGNWDYVASCINLEMKGVVRVTKPSCVQHIGMKSSMGHAHADVAQDFKALHLKDVTLFGIDAHNVKGMLRAAEICQRDIAFGALKVITERLFPGKTNDEGRRNYSTFMIKELTKHFTTSHVLTIHADGYILNPKAWDNRWLEYDYIGATWGYKDNMNVGNGGFSLRSKKLCDILANDAHIRDLHPEDDKICRKYRPYLEEKYGIKFAPEEVANRFSIEAYGASAFKGGNLYKGQFGFHGNSVDMSEYEQYGVSVDTIFNHG